MTHDVTRIAVTSRALFNLERENAFFEEAGEEQYLKEYKKEQVKMDYGGVYLFLKMLQEFQHVKLKFEIWLLSSNNPNSHVPERIDRELKRPGRVLDIPEERRFYLAGGVEEKCSKLQQFKIDLFLSCNPIEVSKARELGFASGLVRTVENRPDDHEAPLVPIVFRASKCDNGQHLHDLENTFKEGGMEATLRLVADYISPTSKAAKVISKLQEFYNDHLDKVMKVYVIMTDRLLSARTVETIYQAGVHVDEFKCAQDSDSVTEHLENIGAVVEFFCGCRCDKDLSYN